MPLRLVRTWEPTRLLDEDWIRSEPYATAGYDPSTVTLLDGNATGDAGGAQPSTVHRDLGANWAEIWSRWDIDANTTPPKLRSAPMGRVPGTTYRGVSPDYDGSLPAGCPTEFYGSLLQWVGPVPAAGFVVDVYGLGQPVSHDNWLLFRFDPNTGTGYGYNGRGRLFYFENWVPEVTALNVPILTNQLGDVRIACADDYQGLFWLGPVSVNGAPVNSAGPMVPREVWEGSDARMNGSPGGIFLWCDDGRYEDPDTGTPANAFQTGALAVAQQVNVWEIPATLPARFRSTVPSGYTMRWVSDNLGNDADAFIVEDLGTGAEVAAPDYLGTWEYGGPGFSRIEVEDDGASTIYVEGVEDLAPFTTVVYGEETDFPPPLDPGTGEPVVPGTPDPSPLPDDWRNFFDDFNTITHTLEEASITRRPDAISPDYLRAHTLGPVALNDTAEGVAAWVWEAWADNATGEVFIRRENATHDGWDPETLVFAFTGTPVSELDVAFNQNAQPEVSAERAGNLWHYYYHPVDEAYRFEDFGEGRTPRVLLDNQWDTANSDIIIFFLDDTADRMRYRIQSERYENVHDTPLRSVATAFLEDVVRTYGYRLQIIYTVHWAAIGFWQCKSFVTALYPVPLVPEGVDVASGLLGTVVTPTLLGTLAPEGLDPTPGVVPTVVSPIAPPLAPEGLDATPGVVPLVTKALSPTLVAEGLDIAAGFLTASYTPLIPLALTTEGLDISNGLLSATLAP